MPNSISCIITDDEPKMVELLADTLAELYPEIEVKGNKPLVTIAPYSLQVMRIKMN